MEQRPRIWRLDQRASVALGGFLLQCCRWKPASASTTWDQNDLVILSFFLLHLLPCLNFVYRYPPPLHTSSLNTVAALFFNPKTSHSLSLVSFPPLLPPSFPSLPSSQVPDNLISQCSTWYPTTQHNNSTQCRQPPTPSTPPPPTPLPPAPLPPSLFPPTPLSLPTTASSAAPLSPPLSTPSPPPPPYTEAVPAPEP